ncbi:hypothetical protein AAFM46_11030 [Arthrobacter sp. TMP15]|uniref:hypothetical protein n=1 Tax=Arthrobacter sp. TMP15 TaxID=3140789 RepID=UPI0031BAECAB
MMFRYQGIEFGGDTGSLLVTGFKPGAAEIRGNDTARPNRDGTIAGREFLGSATWAFDISTNEQDLAEALATASALEAAWKDPAVRLAPNTLAPLSYETAGRWRRVYGRPGLYTPPDGDHLTTLGVGRITADFKVHKPGSYDDAETSVALTIVPASTGGLMAPLVAPLSTVRSSAPRAGFVTNAGDAPTPLKATIHGPITEPWVRSPEGWEVGLTGSLAYDESVTVDPLAGTVTRQDGSPANGRLTRKTRLSGTLLQPGITELTFGGIDLTGTARAVLSWRNAYTSI